MYVSGVTAGTEENKAEEYGDAGSVITRLVWVIKVLKGEGSPVTWGGMFHLGGTQVQGSEVGMYLVCSRSAVWMQPNEQGRE